MLDLDMALAIQSPLLDRMSVKVRSCLLARGRVRRFPRGTTICLQGEPAETLKIVLDGWVKLYRVSANGHEAVLATLTRGESFDEIGALQGQRSQFSAEAVCDCRVVFLDISAICSCENAAQEISEAVMSAASGHLDDMMGQIEQLKAKSGVQRLSEFLIAQCKEGAGPQNLVLPFEKVVLAGKLGMKPESLSRAFAKLKKIGVQSELKRVRIAEVARLRAFCEESAALV